MATLEIKGAKNIKHGGIWNRYASMDFPPYKYQPYPRYVPIGEGKGVIVNSKEEETQVLQKHSKK